MFFLPRIELYVLEDESILPANKTPPWPESFFIKFSVNPFVNVYHSEGLFKNSAGETVNSCLCFDPVEAGSLYNTLYHPMQDFISRDGAEKFFNYMLDSFEIEIPGDHVDNFSSKMRSMACEAHACGRKIVPVVVKIKVDVWEEYHPGSFEFCIPEYVDKIRGMGSGNCVCHSSVQILKRPKLDSSCKEQCTICLAILDGEQEALQLPCSHLYHSDCILAWFKNNSTCPLCRCIIE